MNVEMLCKINFQVKMHTTLRLHTFQNFLEIFALAHIKTF